MLGVPAMVIELMGNKRFGPGGGTRHLHQGGELVSTGVIKLSMLLDMVSSLTTAKISANNKFAPVANTKVAANGSVQTFPAAAMAA